MIAFLISGWHMMRCNIRKTLRNFAVAVNVVFDPGPEA